MFPEPVLPASDVTVDECSLDKFMEVDLFKSCREGIGVELLKSSREGICVKDAWSLFKVFH